VGQRRQRLVERRKLKQAKTDKKQRERTEMQQMKRKTARRREDPDESS